MGLRIGDGVVSFASLLRGGAGLGTTRSDQLWLETGAANPSRKLPSGCIRWSVLLMLLMCSIASAAQFQNGSFELGSVPPHGGVTLQAGSTAMPGWVVLPSDVDWIDFVGDALASDGAWFLDLNGTQTGGIQQTFDTVAGTAYTVTFDMKANTSDLSLSAKSLQVSAAGASQVFTYVPTVTNSGGPWQTQTFTFTATAAQTVLAFQSLVPNSNEGPLLDNVRVSGCDSSNCPSGTTIVSQLGTAGPSNFTLLSLGGSNSQIDLDGHGEKDETERHRRRTSIIVQGNAGVPNSGAYDARGSTILTGTLYLGSQAIERIGGGSQIQGGIQGNQDALLNAAVTDALKASSSFSKMVATATVSGNMVDLNGRQTLTVTGAAGTNVLDLTGIELSGRSTLIFSAPAGAQFIINNSGDFEVSGAASILLRGGLTPYDVVFNQTSQQVQILGHSNVSGILLAPKSDIHLKGTFTGEVIGAQSRTIEISGKAKVVHTPPGYTVLVDPNLGVTIGHPPTWNAQPASPPDTINISNVQSFSPISETTLITESLFQITRLRGANPVYCQSASGLMSTSQTAFPCRPFHRQ